jgi:hypothetical protein
MVGDAALSGARVGSIANRTDAEGATVTQATAADFTDRHADLLGGGPADRPVDQHDDRHHQRHLLVRGQCRQPVQRRGHRHGSVGSQHDQAFSWTVTNTNRAPTTIGTLANATVREGDVLAIVTAGVFADADGDTLTFSTRVAHEMRRPLSQRRAPGAGTEP